MRFLHIFLITLIFCFSPLAAENFTGFPEDLPFEDLTDAETAQLKNGDKVFRVLDSYRDICLKPVDDENREIISIIRDVKPNFLAEVIIVVPINGIEAPFSLLFGALTDVLKFDTIPYYSKDNDKWYKLFYDSEVFSRNNPADGETVINVTHRMKPFDSHENRYEYFLDDNSMTFMGRNTTPLYYKGLRVVKNGKFINLLRVEKKGDYLIVYGAGGASAFTFFGLFGGDRMDTAFTGRIEAFFSWFYNEYLCKMTDDI